VPKKNKNPTLRMWGKTLQQKQQQKGETREEPRRKADPPL